jgi:N-acetylneuraminic acid mutarotase
MINNIGYIGLGSTGTGMSKELWQYEPVTNTWTRKQNFPGAARAGAPAFAIGNKGFVGFGGYNVDFWEYEPVSDKWTQKANLQSYGAERSVTFTIGDKGYMATGLFLNQELWEFNPQ